MREFPGVEPGWAHRMRPEPQPELPDGDDRDRDLSGRRSGRTSVLLNSIEERGIRDRDPSSPATAGHGSERSSVVSGSSSAKSLDKPGSARQTWLSLMKAAQATIRGREDSGTSSATGRPLTVTRSRCPASTRRKTALTLFRSSRAAASGTSPRSSCATEAMPAAITSKKGRHPPPPRPRMRRGTVLGPLHLTGRAAARRDRGEDRQIG